MNVVTRKTLLVVCGVMVALVVALGSASDALAQIAVHPDGNGLSWKLGGYGVTYRWDNAGNFYSEGQGPGGVKGNYLSTPAYRGWSHWSNGKATGSWSSPVINGGAEHPW